MLGKMSANEREIKDTLSTREKRKKNVSVTCFVTQRGTLSSNHPLNGILRHSSLWCWHRHALCINLQPFNICLPNKWKTNKLEKKKAQKWNLLRLGRRGIKDHCSCERNVSSSVHTCRTHQESHTGSVERHVEDKLNKTSVSSVLAPSKSSL